MSRTTLDPIYKEYYDILKQKLKNCNSQEEKFDELVPFAEKFYMLPDDYQYLLKLVPRFSRKLCETMDEITNRVGLNTVSQNPGIEHFEIKYPKELHNDILSKSQFYEHNITELENMLLYPHNHLKEVYNLLKRFGAKPISATLNEKYNAVLDVVRKLPRDKKKLNDESNEEMTNRVLPDDDEEWLKFVKKITYEKAVIANIELRLQKKQNYLNKNIWKYYFKYMKTQDSLGLLDVYRRYCRLFISDNTTREEFQNEIERFGEMGINVTKYWSECIKFELDFSNFESANKVLKRAFNKSKRISY